jgi:heptosyltransferase II
MKPVVMNPQRILVRGVNWLGDAVMTTPALQRLRERFPEAEITLLTQEKLKDLWPGHPAANRVLTFGAKEGVLAIARRLRAERFDLALLLPNSPRSGLESWLAGIPRRVGGAWPWRDWLLTDVVLPAPGLAKMRKRTATEVRRLVAGQARSSKPGVTSYEGAHQLHHYLRLVGHLGGSLEATPPKLFVGAQDLSAVRARFGLGGERPWIGLNAGAEYGPAKRWPKESFIAAAHELQERMGCGLVLFGGPGDVALADEIATALGSSCGSRPELRLLAGQTSLRELCAALACCRVLLTNDTGPMHVAAALGVPVVVPFGSTSPELTGPGLPGDPRHQLLKSAAACAPCFLRECPIDFRCMKEISVPHVVAAVRRICEARDSPR